MMGKSIIISCILLALVLLSASADARIHFGPLFGVLIIPQNDIGEPRHTDFLVGGSGIFPLVSYFGVVLEGGLWIDRFNRHFGESETGFIIFMGGGGRFYPLPGKLGIVDPYINATAGLRLYLSDDFSLPRYYVCFNLGSNINVKGMRIIPYVEGGVLLRGFYTETHLAINITTGFLF